MKLNSGVPIMKGTTGADATPASAPFACAAGWRQVGGRAGGS
jgi:hypothetical protein